MQIVAIIPARYDSSRFPGKPLALIAGKPMIQWVYEQAGQVPDLSEIYVATDDDRIGRCVHSFGGKYILTSKNHLSGSDRLAEAAEIIGLSQEALVVNIQGDQPVFPPSLITQVIAPLLQEPETDMATPIRQLSDPAAAVNPNIVKVVFDHRNFALYFSRSPIPHYRDDTQDAVYYKHIGIYVYRHEFLQRFVQLPPGIWETAEKLEQLRALEHGHPIKVVKTTGETLEVDVPEDLARVEDYLNRRG
ncbi:3-deoxy-manno-octulosonate cytidylyltransferase [Desulfobacca acetoxidans]|uniref:3-deoxy-manno-octulosonate cytidylyltransferase n=1 Tax=Desulfobacca acetoxidans (strain ATCC 700848 / DSM 11109 / ASRB2) TaxID=880072 RepID=F2NCS6_DESAR|nr:3-deoxy-manno-octulosonate cytidylyltransferase [Desulfobacca acetoxidans]AEB09357.1 3-deoxy-manno-octulosonate cytidylyltransferase [Desulfobacca acetoxidans DSM 11109]